MILHPSCFYFSAAHSLSLVVSMAEDPQRNFRSTYYEKVGFRGVEEKKSLEILLKDNPLGKSFFCVMLVYRSVSFFCLQGHSMVILL